MMFFVEAIHTYIVCLPGCERIVLY